MSQELAQPSEVACSNIDALVAHAGPFVTIAERTRMPLLLCDPQLPGNPIIYANDSFLAFSGFSREAVIGRSFDFLSGPETAPLQFDEALTDPFAGFPEICLYRKDGSEVWVSMVIGPVLGIDGTTKQLFMSFIDVTQKRQNERLNFLLEELNHRVKNTLATVQSIVSQTLRNAGVSDQVVTDVGSRLLALGKTHDLIGRAGPDGTNLGAIIKQVSQPYQSGDHSPDRITYQGPEVLLSPKSAIALGIMFNELFTNATKYGALSSDGCVDITWHVDAAVSGDRVSLVWQESGGPSAHPPIRQGFGTRMIRKGLAQEIRGEVNIDFAPTGVICCINFPASGHFQ